MYRRILSIAFYFCATGLTFLFVAQLAGGFFPAFQIQFWPVALAGMFTLSAFLLPETDCNDIPQSRYLLRCLGLVFFLLSPFLAWTARLASFGVGFAPVPRHIYLQVVSMVDLVVFPFFLCVYATSLQAFCGVKLRPLGRKMLGAPLWFLIVPFLAVFAGLIFLTFGKDGIPFALLPNVLWTILCDDSSSDICAVLCCMALATQAAGVLCQICAKPPKTSLPDIEDKLAKYPELAKALEELAEATAKQKNSQNDQTD